MKKCTMLLLICIYALVGCKRYEPIADTTEAVEATSAVESEQAESLTDEIEVEDVLVLSDTSEIPERTPVKVKGIYVSAYVAGTKDMMKNILQKVDETEINAVVIDVKDDDGRITFRMDSPTVNEIDACKVYIGDIESLVADMKARGIYVIARVVAFRDPYLAEKKPEWSLKLANGESYRDKKGLAWVNPYKKEVWDYLVEVGIEAHKVGFDEVQFDYIRFSTEKGINDVVFNEADTKGLSKTDIITEFNHYAYEKFLEQGIFLAADVFGAIIGSEEDSASVGQVYGDMAQHLDYICPMIYPSHYGAGNFGIDYPDTKPYETILAALKGSKKELKRYETDGENQAIVRPWLQDFTARYLKNHIEYGPKEIREQIQGVYDAGYDEWILWSAACKYNWDGLLTPEEAAEEEKQIQESRAALPPETEAATIKEDETSTAAESTEAE